MPMDSDDERDQQNGDGSDNDEDEVMEDADADPDADEEDDGEDNDDDNENDEEDNDEQDDDFRGDSQQPANRSRSTVQPPVRPLPKLRPGANTAKVYDIVPYVAAPQSTSINAFTATPCMRWLFTGGSDGYIRRYDWFGSVNGKLPLTVAQRHPFVDSVTRAGMLVSYWENEEPPIKSNLLHVPETPDDLKLSPVYSLAIQTQSLWLLSGLESGGINLQSVRHEEGKIITTLRKHKSAVSVLTLGQDERTCLSGSWDGSVIDWDLNTGNVIREYQDGTSGQVSSVLFRSYTTDTTWDEIRREPLLNGVSSSRPSAATTNGTTTNGSASSVDADAPGSPESTHSFTSLFGDDDDIGMGGDGDEMNQAIVNGLDGPVASQDSAAGGDSAHSVTVAANGTSEPPTTAGAATTPGPPSSQTLSNGTLTAASPGAGTTSSGPTTDQNTILVSSMDGILRLWDRRAPQPVAMAYPSKGAPPWCMQATWSTDGNFVYAGRRNGSVDEYSLRHGMSEATRNLKFPLGSGSVTALCPMPNSRHLICASYDNLRLYDLKHQPSKGNTVPFLIIPGHHGGALSTVHAAIFYRSQVTVGGKVRTRRYGWGMK